MNDKLYSMLINGLCLAAAPYEEQIKVLPNFVNQTDEVVNAVEYIYVRQLVKSGFINSSQGLLFKAYEDYLESYIEETGYSVLEPKERLRVDPWFQKLREEATNLLSKLNQPYNQPSQLHTIYVKGA